MNSPWSCGDPAGLAEGFGDQLGAADRVLVPLAHAGRAVHPDAAGRTDADFAHLLADGAGLADLGQKPRAVIGAAHGRAAARPTPDGGDEGADLQAEAGDMVRHPPHLARIGVDGEMRGGDEQVDAVKLLSVRRGHLPSAAAGCPAR